MADLQPDMHMSGVAIGGGNKTAFKIRIPLLGGAQHQTKILREGFSREFYSFNFSII
jgi:hypothetical protein